MESNFLNVLDHAKNNIFHHKHEVSTSIVSYLFHNSYEVHSIPIYSIDQVTRLYSLPMPKISPFMNSPCVKHSFSYFRYKSIFLPIAPFIEVL